MKIRYILSAASLLCTFLFAACSDDSDNGPFEVRYTVTGDDVNQFKISQGTTDKFVSTPFSGSRDTTVIVEAGTHVKLDTKADNSLLIGSIYVNDELKATGTDADANGDGKTQVKIEYSIP